MKTVVCNAISKIISLFQILLVERVLLGVPVGSSLCTIFLPARRIFHPFLTLFFSLYREIGGRNGRIFGSSVLPENDGDNARYLRKIRSIMDY